jgi:hypothetical protein
MSEKIGRNEPCSCGSGMKYKKCCGSITAGQSRGSARQSAPTRPESPVLEVATENMLMNRVKREAQVVAAGFDGLCEAEVKEIDRLYSAGCSALVCREIGSRWH